MKDKEKKLSKALNEYFGKDVGDVVDGFIETEYCPERIEIIVKPHKPTFEEKRKELVDQLDKDLKEIDGSFGAKELDESDVRIYIMDSDIAICEIRNDLWNFRDIHMYNVCLSVVKAPKIMNAILKFVKALEHLKDKYDDENI